MDRKKLLEQVKKAVLDVEPGAEIILYGSRSRGNSKILSDWDFLVLVDGKLNPARIDNIRHNIYEVEWESEEVLSSIVRTRDYWNDSKYQAMPFYKSVKKYGISV